MSKQEVESEKHVKKDSEGQSQTINLQMNVKRSQQNGFKKLRKKAALLKDIERRGCPAIKDLVQLWIRSSRKSFTSKRTKLLGTNVDKLKTLITLRARICWRFSRFLRL